MTLFLTILKIIGIILLSIIGLILLILLLLLFMPIHYESDGLYDDENRPLIKAKVDWLFYIVRFRFCMQGKEKDMSLKVLWIKLYPKDTEEGDDMAASEESDKLPDDESRASDSKAADEAFSKMEESTKNDTSLHEEEISKEVEEIPPEDINDNKSEPEKPRLSPFEKVKDTIDKIKFKIDEICGKIRDGKLKAEDLLEKLEDERTMKAVRELCLVLKKLLWHIRPRRFSLNLRYGMEDPSLTGQIYGIYNSFYPVHRGIPVVVPDFNEKCLDGSYMIKGHIQLFFILTAAVRIYFSKDIKRLYNIIKKR